jgi:hypothetical protein
LIILIRVRRCTVVMRNGRQKTVWLHGLRSASVDLRSRIVLSNDSGAIKANGIDVSIVEGGTSAEGEDVREK